jgi:hypothetical protein
MEKKPRAHGTAVAFIIVPAGIVSCQRRIRAFCSGFISFPAYFSYFFTSASLS